MYPISLRMLKIYQGTRRLYDSSQQNITAISKALCEVTEGLSILLFLLLLFLPAVVLLSTITNPLINSKASVENYLYAVLYAALKS
jgi:hypothetical protein